MVSLLLSGCASAPTVAPSELASDQAVIADLREAVAEVADDNAVADEAVNAVLDVMRRIDETLVALRDVARLDETLSGYAAVHESAAAVSVDDLRAGYLDVAADVDDARDALASTRLRLDDPWETSYLDAQDAVLLAVRAYAEAADRLAQLIVQHWPTYATVDALVADFASRRGNFRSTDEAADALAVELDTILDDVAMAQAQLAEFRTLRTSAGRTVNDATADAVSIYEQRPATGASPRG